MRRLHPPGPLESLVAQGVTTAPGGDESWSVHTGHEGRRMLRVDAGDSLWHAVLDGDGRPERVQVRVGSGPDAVDATFTFFDNEVLVWRKGAAPPVEAIPLTSPVSLAWPPSSCREVLAASDGSACFVVRIVDRDQGGVVGTPEVGA